MEAPVFPHPTLLFLVGRCITYRLGPHSRITRFPGVYLGYGRFPTDAPTMGERLVMGIPAVVWDIGYDRIDMDCMADPYTMSQLLGNTRNIRANRSDFKFPTRNGAGSRSGLRAVHTRFARGMCGGMLRGRRIRPMAAFCAFRARGSCGGGAQRVILRFFRVRSAR